MIISRTPLRVPIIGGGTDFREFYSREQGSAIGFTIDKYVYVIVKERFDDMIYVNYSVKETVDSLDKLEHGLVREAMRICGVEKGIEITALADLPGGTGLGSSSCFAVGLLNALYAYKGIEVDREQIAREACKLEIDILGYPIGKQDQYICALGGLIFLRFESNGDVAAEKIYLSTADKELISSYLHMYYLSKHRTSSQILFEQRVVSSEGSVDEFLRVVKLRAKSLRDSLLQHQWEEIGHAFHENLEYKKKLLSRISSSEIDDIYMSAREAGAIGGKFLGAGSGGFFVVFCNKEHSEKVGKALTYLKEYSVNLETSGSEIIFNA